MSETDDRQAVRARLTDILKKVPDKVNNGSYQDAVRFKKFHADASKVAANERASLNLLQNTLLRCGDYYGSV